MKILGYVCDHNLPTVTQRDAQMLDVINIAFGKVDKDFTLGTWELKHNDCLQRIRAWKPDIRFVLSVGGWTAGGFSLMSRMEEGRRRFAESCAEYVKNADLDGIDIYPNPSHSTVTINTNSDRPLHAVLLDMSGHAVANFEIRNSKYVIDVSSLTPGAYFIRITDEQSTVVRKLIVD